VQSLKMQDLSVHLLGGSSRSRLQYLELCPFLGTCMPTCFTGHDSLALCHALRLCGTDRMVPSHSGPPCVIDGRVIDGRVAGYGACSPAQISGCPTVGAFLEDYFSYKFGFRWWCVLILFFFLGTFRVFAMITLKLVNHQHR
jgi:hypothetical protein